MLVHPIEQFTIDAVIKLRHQHKLKARDIANILGTSISFVGNVESSINPAKYNLKHINLLAEYFQLSPKFFLPHYPL